MRRSKHVAFSSKQVVPVPEKSGTFHHRTSSFTRNKHHLNPRQKVQDLRHYYLENLADDPIDGSRLDCAVMDSLRKLEQEFS